MQKTQGFIWIPVIIAFLISTVVGSYYFAKKASSKKVLISNEQNSLTTRENKELSSSQKDSRQKIETQVEGEDKIEWIEQDNKKEGVFYKIPKDWSIVYALGDNNFEIEIKDPNGDNFVLIGVNSNNKINNEISLKKAIDDKEKEINSTESYEVSNFKSEIKGNTGIYYANGKEDYISFKNNPKSFEEFQPAKYNFQEKGVYQIGGKSFSIHGMTLIDKQTTSVVTKIIDSFKLQ